MNYLLIGLLASIGWYLGRVICNVIEEITFCRLHKTKWYPVLCGKEKKNKNIEKNRIGF